MDEMDRATLIEALTKMRKHRAVRSVGARDKVIEAWSPAFETLRSWVQEVTERFQDVEQLFDDFSEAGREDLPDFQSSLDDAVGQLIEQLE